MLFSALGLTTRNYPKEFAISREISVSFVLNYALNWFSTLFVVSDAIAND